MNDFEMISAALENSQGVRLSLLAAEEGRPVLESALWRWAGITVERWRELLEEESAPLSAEELEPAGADLVRIVPPTDLTARRSRIVYGLADSPFGGCRIETIDGAVCGLTFGGPDAGGGPNADGRRDDDLAGELAERIFRPAGERPADEQSDPIEVILAGTAFQRQVWEALLRIPAGRVTTYGELARLIGTPAAARAVGAAMGANRVGYLIPCHRVIARGGGAGGFRWGVPRKNAMLLYERARVAGATTP